MECKQCNNPELYDRLADVWEASVRVSHHFLTEEDIEYYRQKITSQYLPQVDIYIISEDMRICGFIGLSDMIEMLFVHPDFMGKGIGKSLLTYAIHNKSMTKVDVNEQNAKAVKFYISNGFVVTGRSQLDSDGRPFPILHLSLSTK